MSITVEEYNTINRVTAQVLGKYFKSSFRIWDTLENVALDKILKEREKFDADKGVKFSTWSFTVIRNALTDYMRKNSFETTMVSQDDIVGKNLSTGKPVTRRQAFEDENYATDTLEETLYGDAERKETAKNKIDLHNYREEIIQTEIIDVHFKNATARKIIELHRKGVKPRFIVEQIGCNRQYVARIKKQFNDLLAELKTQSGVFG